MSVKRIRSKRKSHVTELSGMERLFLYRDIREHLNNGVPLSVNDQNILLELRITAEEFRDQWLAEAEAKQKERYLLWVEDAARNYGESPNETTRQKLTEALERVGMDVSQYIYDNFEKLRPVSFTEYKERKNALPGSILSR